MSPVDFATVIRPMSPPPSAEVTGVGANDGGVNGEGGADNGELGAAKGD